MRLAVAGTGPIAALHLAAFREVPDVGVPLVASRTLESAKRFAAEHSIPEAVAFDALLERGNADFDALLVVVPALSMAEMATRLGALGRPMLLEKPVGMSLPETEAAAATIDVPVMVGLNRRFYEVVQRGAEMIREAGGARFVEVHMPEDIKALSERYGPDTLEAWHYGNSVHLVDLFRLFGGEVESVERRVERRSYWDRAHAALLDFEGGAHGMFNAQWYAPGPWRVSVYADGLNLTFAPIEQGLALRMPGRQRSDVLAEGPDTRLKPGFFGQAKAFADLVREDTRHPDAADMQDYARSVRLVRDLME